MQTSVEEVHVKLESKCLNPQSYINAILIKIRTIGPHRRMINQNRRTEGLTDSMRG